MSFKKISALIGSIVENKSLFNLKKKLVERVIIETKRQAIIMKDLNASLKANVIDYNKESYVKIGFKYNFHKYTKQPYQGVMINIGTLGAMSYLLNSDLEVVSPGYHSINLANCTAQTGATKVDFVYHLTSLN